MCNFRRDFHETLSSFRVLDLLGDKPRKLIFRNKLLAINLYIHEQILYKVIDCSNLLYFSQEQANFSDQGGYV